ncbi:MAG: RtcB family protein [Phycisphaerales bacterium]|nr:RtcB family protein [Phycisphaerales bacterium]
MKQSIIGPVPDDVRVAAWFAQPPDSDVKAALQRIARAPDVRALAIMPDVHLAEAVCVGAIVATDRLVYPQAVGGDIGCGMTALRIDTEAASITRPRSARRVLDALRVDVPVMRHRSLAAAPSLPVDLILSDLSDGGLAGAIRREAAIEFGTLGRGNHFLEAQAGDDGALWLMVHSGSRCVGQAIARHHLSQAEPAGGGLRSLDTATPRGAAYVNDASWAARFADFNRRCMLWRAVEIVTRIVGGEVAQDSFVSCDHNHVRREFIAGAAYWVHRKGANAAGDGVPGIIAGSMGSQTVITTGRGVDEAICSSSHGAGRRMSRSQARQRILPRSFRRQLGNVIVDEEVLGRLIEEAPAAYKDIAAVLRAQSELIRIHTRLQPLLCYKGA